MNIFKEMLPSQRVFALFILFLPLFIFNKEITENTFLQLLFSIITFIPLFFSFFLKMQEVICNDYDFLAYCIDTNKFRAFNKRLKKGNKLRAYDIAYILYKEKEIKFLKSAINSNINFCVNQNEIFVKSSKTIRDILIKNKKVAETIQKEQPQAYKEYKLSLNSFNF